MPSTLLHLTLTAFALLAVAPAGVHAFVPKEKQDITM